MRNAQVHSRKVATMMVLPPETASAWRKSSDAKLPNAITKHAHAPTAWMAVRT